jgi:dihydroorotase
VKELDVAVTNGTVALPTGATVADVGISGEKIAVISEPGAIRAADVIDASGMLVLPGAIDMHVHFREPGFEHKEDFRHGTAAAACGGVTTICDMPNTHPPVINKDRFRQKLDLVSKNAYVDYGLWAGGVCTEEFAELDALGAIGLKVYMNRAVRASDPYASELSMPDDGTFVKVLKAAAALDWLVCVHVANSFIDEVRREELQAVGSLDPADVCCSFRSLESVEALSRAAWFAKNAGARLHIAHISLNSIAAIDALLDARRNGTSITAEVVPPALTFHELKRLGTMGIPFSHPPDDLEQYWRALASGVIEVVATDHAPHTRAEKEAGRENPWTSPPGYPGVETSLPLVLDAMLNGRIDLDVLRKVTAENPACILGLADKGAIAPGRDADLVIVDPQGEWIVDETRLHSKAGWSPFHGRRLRGRIRLTVLRGTVVARNGDLAPHAPGGRQLRRTRDSQIAGNRPLLADSRMSARRVGQPFPAASCAERGFA